MLGPRAMKILRFLHLVFASLMAGGFFGVLLLLGGASRVKLAGGNLFPYDLALFQLLTYGVNWPFFGLLATALAFSLFTPWGFFRHRFLIVKWAAVLVLFALVAVYVNPAVTSLVALSDGGFYPSNAAAEYEGHRLGAKAVVLSLHVLILAVFLVSVFKPWGRREAPPRINPKTARLLALAVTAVLVVLAGAGAMVQQRIRTMPIADTDLSRVPEGTHVGEAVVGGFTYGVEVVVKAGRIKVIRVLKNRSAPWARYAEGVIPRILAKQNANVDAITGATTTSKALMKAVERALAGKH